MIGQLFMAWPNFAIVLGKAAIFCCGLELGIEWTIMKQTFLDLSFILSKKQEIVSAEE